MTQDEILDLAELAGHENLIKFAKLVAATEREACAGIVDEWANGLSGEPEMFEIAKEIRARGQE